MKQFKGTIADKKLSDFNQYDNKLTRYEDRVNYIEGFLYDGEFVHDFFATYFSTYYSVSPSQDGYLAEQDAVCKLLDILGTYLLGANDIQSNRKIEYKFWKSEREYKDYKESTAVSASTSDEDGKQVEVIDMFIDKKNDKNQKIVKPIEVTKKDIKEIKELGQLEDAIIYLKSPKGMTDIREHAVRMLEQGHGSEEEVQRLNYIAKNTERYVDRYVKSLRESQLLIKKAIKRPVEFKSVLKDEGVADKLDAFDFMEEAEVKELLGFLNQEDLMTDIGVLVHDLKALLKKSNLSPRELEVVTLYEEGLRQSEIAEELDINKASVRKMEYRIAKKVVKTYEKQVEEYRDSVRQKKV